MSQQPKGPHSVRLIALIEKLSHVLELADAQLLSDAAQTAQRLESGEGFNAVAVVSLRDGRPLLDCSWMGMLAQITPEQARSMALGLVETAAEAEADAVLLQFFRDTGLSDERAASGVAVVRRMRAERQQVVGEKQEPSAGLQNVVPFGSKPS